MKYSIRELKAKISSKMLEESFEVTNHNVSVGRFTPIGNIKLDDGRELKRPTQRQVKKIVELVTDSSIIPRASSEVVQKIEPNKNRGACPQCHGMLDKYGKCLTWYKHKK